MLPMNTGNTEKQLQTLMSMVNVPPSSTPKEVFLTCGLREAVDQNEILRKEVTR